MPTPPADPLARLRERRDALRTRLIEVGDMRPGSLVERFRQCGKPNCHCAREGHRGHGPSFSLTHAVKGKTVTKVIPREAVETTREQIAEYRRFRALVQELVEANERLCDAELRLASRQPRKRGLPQRALGQPLEAELRGNRRGGRGSVDGGDPE